MRLGLRRLSASPVCEHLPNTGILRVNVTSQGFLTRYNLLARHFVCCLIVLFLCGGFRNAKAIGWCGRDTGCDFLISRPPLDLNRVIEPTNRLRYWVKTRSHGVLLANQTASGVSSFMTVCGMRTYKVVMCHLCCNFAIP